MKVRELFKVMGCFNRIEIYECKKDFSEHLIWEGSQALRYSIPFMDREVKYFHALPYKDGIKICIVVK